MSEARDVCAVLAQVNAVNAISFGNDSVGQPNLLLELQRSRAHGKRARSLARRNIAVDDAAGDSMSRQPQRE